MPRRRNHHNGGRRKSTRGPPRRNSNRANYNATSHNFRSRASNRRDIPRNNTSPPQGVHHRLQRRSTSVPPGIDEFNRRLHPDIIKGWEAVISSIKRVQMNMDELAERIDKVKPSEDHIKWDHPPSMIVVTPGVCSPCDNADDVAPAVPQHKYMNEYLSRTVLGSSSNLYSNPPCTQHGSRPAPTTEELNAAADTLRAPFGTFRDHQSQAQPSSFNTHLNTQPNFASNHVKTDRGDGSTSSMSANTNVPPENTTRPSFNPSQTPAAQPSQGPSGIFSNGPSANANGQAGQAAWGFPPLHQGPLPSWQSGRTHNENGNSQTQREI